MDKDWQGVANIQASAGSLLWVLGVLLDLGPIYNVFHSSRKRDPMPGASCPMACRCPLQLLQANSCPGLLPRQHLALVPGQAPLCPSFVADISLGSGGTRVSQAPKPILGRGGWSWPCRNLAWGVQADWLSPARQPPPPTPKYPVWATG